MAAHLQKQFNERVAAAVQCGVDAPRELAELDARLDRLRSGFETAIPTWTPTSCKRRSTGRRRSAKQLAATIRPASRAAKVLTMLPKAAESYRKQVIAGLDGHPEATARARSILRELIGTVTIKPDGDQVWGEFEARPDVLLRATDRDGRDDRI